MKSTPTLLTLTMSIASLLSGSALGASFQDDVTFLQSHTPVVVLADKTGQAKVAIAPAMQGRIMTSTAAGESGRSFGWINRELIASGKTQPHINVFGGEDRFWIGPEGGQFSIFFAKGAPFDLEHWFTPAPIDTEPFELVKQAPDQADFRRTFNLTNYSGTTFRVRVNRSVELLKAADAWKHLGVAPAAGLSVVAFQSLNQIENAGLQAWTKETGLLSIWILGMFNPSPGTTIVVPIKSGPENQLGRAVTSDYFGPIPADRLVLKNGILYFSGDGLFRSKIGISPLRCKPILGSYDADHKVLTLVQFSFQESEKSYVNSLWKIQDDPFAGDVANSYNDGPPSPGAKPLGPFYEIESSSPAAALAPGKSLQHLHRTVHLTGAPEDLDRIARATLGAGLSEITSALKPAKAN